MATKKVETTVNPDWPKKHNLKIRAKRKEYERVNAEVELVAGELKVKKKERKLCLDELLALCSGGPDKTSDLEFDEIPWDEQPLRNLGVDAKTKTAIATLLDDEPLVTCGQLAERMKSETFDCERYFNEKMVANIDKAMDELKKKFPGPPSDE